MTIEKLIIEAKQQSPLANNYAEHTQQRTIAMREDFKNLAAQLVTNYEEQKFIDISGQELQKKVLAYIDFEISNLAEFDTKKSSAALPYQIHTHKLSFTLPKIREQLATESGDSDVVRLVSGEFKPDPTFADRYPILRTNSFFGSNKATYEAGKMLCAMFATSDKTIADYNSTSFAHCSPSANLPESFVNSGSKFTTIINGTPAFGFYHGGYAFGGQREEVEQYMFGPEDCSSILAKLLSQTGCPASEYGVDIPLQTSTVHQLYAWRNRQSNPEMFIDRSQDGYNPAIAKYWDTILEDKNPNQGTVKPGDIYVLRKANANENFDTHANGAGHTGVVIGADPESPNKLLIFECARDLEQENINVDEPEKTVWGVGGVGVGSVSNQYEEITDGRVKRTMFLRSKPSFSL